MTFDLNQTTDLDKYSNDELAALAAQWRTRALHGDRDANGRAHELECEIRRRVRGKPTLEPYAPTEKKKRDPWWAFWRN
mgnify:CR=1 FL=1